MAGADAQDAQDAPPPPSGQLWKLTVAATVNDPHCSSEMKCIHSSTALKYTLYVLLLQYLFFGYTLHFYSTTFWI